MPNKQKELWQQEAARIGGPIFAEVLIEIRDSQRQLVEKVTALEGANTRLLSGFPADDIDGHRRYHESVIEWRELRNKMVREALIHAAKVGGVGALGWVAYALWKAFILTVRQ